MRARRVAATVVLALVATACGGGALKTQGLPVAAPSASATPTPTEDPTPVGRWPLTGVPVEVVPDRPVLAAKIENTAAARPLIGIGHADIVYEQIVEGGVTRFAALFHSNIATPDDEIGPIRSARLVDVDLLLPFTPILAYSGARPDVNSALARAGRLGLLPDNGRPVFGRDPDRSRSHDLVAFVDEAYLRGEELDNVGPVSTALTFRVEPPPGGSPALAADIRMTTVNTSGWDFDVDAGVYRRSQNGEPFEVVGDPIGAANVVAIYTSIGTGGCCDTAGNPFVATDLTGEGTAVVLRDGQRWDVLWRKERAGDHLQLLLDNRPFPLAPGPTWFHLTSPASVTTRVLQPQETESATPSASETG